MRVTSAGSLPLSPAALVEQEALDRAPMLKLIKTDVSTGEFTGDPFDTRAFGSSIPSTATART